MDENDDDLPPPVYSEAAFESACSWGLCVCAAILLAIILFWRNQP